MVSIHGRGRITREMLTAAGDSFRAHRFVERARQFHDLAYVAPVATTSERVIGFVVEGNVEDRAKIEVKAKEPERPPGNFAVPPVVLYVALIALLLCTRRLLPDQAQTRDATAFLIDRDDRLDRAQVAQVVDQLAQLHRASDVASEEDKAARLHLAKKRGGCEVEFLARNTGEDQLTR